MFFLTILANSKENWAGKSLKLHIYSSPLVEKQWMSNQTDKMTCLFQLSSPWKTSSSVKIDFFQIDTLNLISCLLKKVLKAFLISWMSTFVKNISKYLLISGNQTKVQQNYHKLKLHTYVVTLSNQTSAFKYVYLLEIYFVWETIVSDKPYLKKSIIIFLHSWENSQSHINLRAYASVVLPSNFDINVTRAEFLLD